MCSIDTAHLQIIHELHLNKNTIVDWSNFLRDVCDYYIEINPVELGGLDDNGQRIDLQIDESQSFQRGQWVEGHWGFGSVERRTHKSCLIGPVKLCGQSSNDGFFQGQGLYQMGGEAYQRIE